MMGISAAYSFIVLLQVQFNRVKTEVKVKVSVKIMLWPTVTRSDCQSVLASSPSETKTRFLLLSVAGLLMWSPLLRLGDWIIFCNVIGSRQAVIPGFKSRETNDRILLSQIQDSPKLEGQVTPEQGGPQALFFFFFVDSCDSQGQDVGIRTRLHTGV
jgi:hypothetical protein